MLTRIRPLGFVAALVFAALLIGSITAWRATAAPDPGESTFVPVTPARILDTRDPINIGLPGPFVSAVSQKLQVTGTVPTTEGTQTVVPTGATGLVLNATVVLPTAAGFVSIRPGDATGAPATSSLNFDAGVIQPNSVTVELPTGGSNAGMIDITYDAFGTAGPTTEMLIDVVGFTTNAGIQALVTDLAAKANSDDVYTKDQSDAALATKADSVDVYTKSETDAALATKADIDQVRAAMLADKVWSAGVSSNGTKSGSGPFTSSRSATGNYSVSFDVTDYDIPSTGQFPNLTITTHCPGYTASIGGGGIGSSGGNLTTFSSSYQVRNHDNVAQDCSAMLHFKFPDPNSGSPLEPLSLEKSTSGAAVAAVPDGASCTTVGDTTTCTEVID